MRHVLMERILAIFVIIMISYTGCIETENDNHEEKEISQNLFVSMASVTEWDDGPIDANSSRIIKISPTGEKSTFEVETEETLLGTGFGLNWTRGSYEIGYLDMAIGQDENIYVTNVDRVDVYSQDGVKIKSIELGLGVTDVKFDSLGNLFVSMASVTEWDDGPIDANSSRIIKISPTGERSTFEIETKDTMLGTGFGLNWTRGSYEIGYLDIAIGQDENIYVTNVDQVDVYSQDGIKIKSIELGLGVTDVEFDSLGNLFVSMASVTEWDDGPIEANSSRLIQITPTGDKSTFEIETEETMLGTGFGLNWTRGSYEIGYLDLAINQDDNIYVTNVDRVDVYLKDGTKIESISLGLGVTAIDFN